MMSALVRGKRGSGGRFLGVMIESLLDACTHAPVGVAASALSGPSLSWMWWRINSGTSLISLPALRSGFINEKFGGGELEKGIMKRSVLNVLIATSVTSLVPVVVVTGIKITASSSTVFTLKNLPSKRSKEASIDTGVSLKRTTSPMAKILP